MKSVPLKTAARPKIIKPKFFSGNFLSKKNTIPKGIINKNPDKPNSILLDNILHVNFVYSSGELMRFNIISPPEQPIIPPTNEWPISCRTEVVISIEIFNKNV